MRVLAGGAERAPEIDVAAAERDLSEASEQMKSANRETLDGLRMRAELAAARLSVARRTET